MKTFLKLCLMLIAAVAALFAWAGVCPVAPGEIVVVRRLGRLLEPTWEPGLHWRFPLGIDRIDRVRSDAVRQLTIGLAELGQPGVDPAAGEMMTGDLNLLRVSTVIQYRALRPVDYVMRAAQVEPLLARSAEAYITRALAVRGVDAVLRTDRQSIAREVTSAVQAASDRYQLGVAVLGASLTDARPPAEVEADFAAVQAAESRRARRANDARSYEETTSAQARAHAQSIQESARAQSERTRVLARARADRFCTLAAEARRYPTLTFGRLYVETLQSLLGRVRRKLILPPGEAIDLTVLGITGDARPKDLAPDQQAGAKPAPTPGR
jgi:modulator of FtsH protease HflK